MLKGLKGRGFKQVGKEVGSRVKNGEGKKKVVSKLEWGEEGKRRKRC